MAKLSLRHSMRLPLDIHNLILDAVADDPDPEYSRRTLWTCAAASRALLPRAYYHLFSYIHIQLDLDSTKLWDSQIALTYFILLLRSSLRYPDVGIARYIRGFELTIRAPDDPQALPFALLTITQSLSELLRAVYSFTRLQYLKLSALKAILSFKQPDGNLYPISEDLVNLCHSPTMSRLALSNFTAVPTSLLPHSLIRHIDMTNVGFSFYSRDHRKFLHQPDSISVDGACFRSVVTGLHGGGGPTGTFIRCQEAFARLRTLELRSNGVDAIPEYLKMARAAPYLDTLYLHIFADPSTIRTLLQASKEYPGIPTYYFHLLTSLSTLQISFHHQENSPESCFLSPLTHFIDVSTFPRSLHTLDIGANASVRIDNSCKLKYDCRPICQKKHWPLLDLTLTKPLTAPVPRLRLFIKFCVDSYREPWFDQVLFNTRTCKAIADVLPHFRNTRLLPLKGQLYVSCGAQQDSHPSGFMVPVP